MKLTGSDVVLVGPVLQVACPFCGARQSVNTNMPWCPECAVEYFRDRHGTIVFDDARKTPRFALAKALNRAGGVTMGTITPATRPEGAATR